MPEIKKLIEVDLPLNDINAQSSREKSIRHGHPSTLHLWWARRPLATARCVLFAQLVDDPSSHPELFPTEETQSKERNRLFDIIRRLAVWENSNDQELLTEAASEIRKYVPDFDSCMILDPFSGGGTIPLEGQRLGLTPIGHDLNPVALIIEKAMLDIPCRFQGRLAVNPKTKSGTANTALRATGLSDDIEFYGLKLRELAEKKIGSNYPKVKDNFGNATLNPFAYIWFRTIKCPNPACGREVPLTKSLDLSTVSSNLVHVELHEDGHSFRTEIKRGKSNEPGTVGKGKVTCPFCHEAFPYEYVSEHHDEIGEKMAAVVYSDKQRRWYISPDEEQISAAQMPRPLIYPDAPLADDPCIQAGYGNTKFSQMFTNRQLSVLLVFSGCLKDIHEQVIKDALASGWTKGESLEKGGDGALAYADAIQVYLSFVIDKMADRNSKSGSWDKSRQMPRNVFGMQAIRLTWDFCETNPFSESSGSFVNMLEWVYEAVAELPCGKQGIVEQFNAENESDFKNVVISTDPPYYNNIDYSDISDFFYIWLKWNLSSIYPSLFSKTVTPKKEELVANVKRNGSKEKAQDFFESGMKRVCESMFDATRKDVPVTVYYAYKQASYENEAGYASSGWETMLSSLISSGFQITGTWPMRTERQARVREIDSSALSSSIVIVCRPRPDDAPTCSRLEFMNELSTEFKEKLEFFKKQNIAPVDLQQAIIGPGMAIYSKYSKIIKADGTQMSVHEALNLINQEINAVFESENNGLDSPSQAALVLYQNYKYGDIKGGDLESLMTAKNTYTSKLEKYGIISGEKGVFRLNHISSYQNIKRLDGDIELPVWTLAFKIADAYSKETIDGAAQVISDADNIQKAYSAKDLLYRLYQIATEKGLSDDAYKFNGPVTDWSEIMSKVTKKQGPVQMTLWEVNN